MTMHHEKEKDIAHKVAALNNISGQIFSDSVKVNAVATYTCTERYVEYGMLFNKKRQRSVTFASFRDGSLLVYSKRDGETGAYSMEWISPSPAYILARVRAEIIEAAEGNKDARYQGNYTDLLDFCDTIGVNVFPEREKF
jgi:hypothetical protein